MGLCGSGHGGEITMSGNFLSEKSMRYAYAGRLYLFSLYIANAIFFFMVFVPVHAMAAEDIRLSTEFKYINSDFESTNNDTGDVTDSKTSSFEQDYNITMRRDLYPFLLLEGGAFFELDDFRSTTDDTTFESNAREIRPFIGLSLRSPLYSAGITFRQTEIKREFQDVPASRDYLKTFNTSFSYRPAGLPHFDLFHDRFHTYNDDKTEDAVSSLSNATVTYNVRSHPVRYSYKRTKTEDLLEGSESVQESHAANTSYQRTFFNGRLSMNASYGVSFDVTRVPVAGTVDAPLSPVQGLYSARIDPRPLDPLTALIDGNVTASTGINIGWTDAGEPDRNIGLDFGFSVSVDQLIIYVDRSVPSSASNTFAWAVYTSPDNTATSVWTLHTVVSPAPFGTFQNRFEISFPEVITRYIKVVVSPLSPIFTGINEIENIFITEMEAFITTSSEDDEKRVDSDHNFSTQLNATISDKTSIGYNLVSYLRKDDSDPSSDRVSLQNAVYIRHIFNRIFNGNMAVSRAESKTTLDSDDVTRRVSHDFSSVLTAAYLPTLSQSLAFGANEEESEEGKFDSRSLFLRTNAALYRGWDAYADVGYTQSESTAGETTSIIFSIETLVVPNNEMSLDARYSESRNEDDEGDTSIEREYDVRATYNPFRYITFFARLLVNDKSDRDRTELQTYTVSWSPFPDGDIQLSLQHNESLRPSDDREDRSTGGNARWNINRYATLILTYYFTTSETVVATSEGSTFSAELDMNF
jgi:hypothetical protein